MDVNLTVEKVAARDLEPGDVLIANPAISPRACLVVQTHFAAGLPGEMWGMRIHVLDARALVGEPSGVGEAVFNCAGSQIFRRLIERGETK